MINSNNRTANKQAPPLRSVAFAFLILFLCFSAFAQPTITSFAPASGPIGTTVTITGTNFNTSFANNIVFFGATKATVSAGSATSLTVTVPSGASYLPISATDIITGLIAYSAKPFITTFPCGGSFNSSSFATKVDFTTGTQPVSVSAGDFDGDGKTDLAIANTGSNSVSVFRNTGSSGTISFAAKVDFTTGGNPRGISTGDFDGDGKLDLAVANTTSNSVSVFRNTGSSGTVSFAGKVDFTTGTTPYSISTGDLDGDGKTDLAVANRNSNSVSVFRNTGSSGAISFATKVDFTTGSTPFSVSTGDLDGDGKIDLAVANNGSNTVSVFRNIGSSGAVSFAAKVDYVTGSQPNDISTGDYDGDGKTDLAVAIYYPFTVSLLRNLGSSGTISFAAKVDFPTAGNSYSISTGDLDGDGKLDLAVVSSAGIISLSRNTGSSGSISFATNEDYGTGAAPYSGSIGDFDGDGKSDLVVANLNSNTVSILRRNLIICPPNITSFSPSSGPIGTTITITGTYFNASFANNIVFFGATKATVSAGSTTSLTVTVPTGATYQPISVTDIATGLTAYSLQPFVTTFACGGVINTSSFAGKVDNTTGTQPYSVSTGDFDGDGKTDLAVVNQNSSSVSVFRNMGSSGTISFAAKVDFTTGTGTYSVSTGDFDGDGKTDLAVANTGSNAVSVFRNTGSSGTISFAPKVDFTTGNGSYSVSTGDFDGDGKTDLAVANYSSTTVSVFRNTGSYGTISFAAKVDFTTGTYPKSVSTGDFDGDGKTDLAVANNISNTVSVFRNTGSSGIISFAWKVDFTTGGNPNSASIADLDGDGKPDLAVVNDGSNTVSVFQNTGGSGTISFAPKVDFTTGAYPYSVSIADLDGDGKTDLAVANQASNTVSVLRNTIISPTVTANATATIVCTGTSVTLTGGGTANTYIWTGGVTDGVVFVPPAGTTTYTVTGTVTATGCQNTATITITVNPLPTVTAIATATTVCAGASITLTGSGTANTYTWTGGVSNGVGFVPPTGTTTYTVTGTINAPGCQNTAAITITVNPLPTVSANATATTVCAGASITLTGGGANTYVWTGGVTDGVGFTPPTGTTTYTVTGTDLNGCSNTATKNITVNPIPIATFTSTPTTKCSGTCNATATITNVTGGQSPYTYQWDANANNQITSTASFLCQGIYSVVIKDANLCSVTENVQIDLATASDPNVYLTNLAAIDQINISPSFAAFYTYNLPATINPNSTNPRNFVDPGKKARFKVECTNQKFNGQSIVSGICKVRSNSPYITITDSSSALNNIGWNDKAWSADEFEINIDPNTPPGTNAYIDFIVQESGQDYSTTCISIPITPLVYSATSPSTIDDDSNPDSQGNDNDICDQGEIIEFYPWLDNVSTLNAEYVRGRFENLDNLSYVNIWNGVPGINTTVYDAGWWNFAFAQPQIINSSSFNTTPEYDFVFNYNNTNIINNFKMYMVMAGGFKLFSGTALSLVQWSLPYTFSGTGSTSIASELENTDGLSVYPNPSNGNVQFSMNNGAVQHIKIYNQIGALVYQSEKESQELNLTGYPKGVYLIQVQTGDKIINKRIVIQ